MIAAADPTSGVGAEVATEIRRRALTTLNLYLVIALGSCKIFGHQTCKPL